MRAHRRTILAAMFAVAALHIASLATGSPSDTDLFRTNVPPNVLLVVDNSKSMTNSVWHADFGKSNPPGMWTNPPANNSLAWKQQTNCTHFRDLFTTFGRTANNQQRFHIYPGGRKVNMQDPTGFVIRTRKTNAKAWEPRVMDITGNPVYNDANANGTQDVGEWDAYYKTCNPEAGEYNTICAALPDYDGDGIGGRTVVDQLGNPIMYTKADSTVVPQLYKYDPDNDLGRPNGIGGAPVKVRTTIIPREVALFSGIDPETYTFFNPNVCGVDPTGWKLWTGEDQATTPNGKTIAIDARYLDFLFSSYGNNARPAVFTPTAANDGVRSKAACVNLALGEPSTYQTFRRTRLMALRLILRTVTCELREDVRFGLAQFRYHGKSGDDNGGYVAVPIDSVKLSNGNPNTYTLHGQPDTHTNHLARVISLVGPDAQTPLNETLFQLYTYFMSRDPLELPPPRDWQGNPVAGFSFPVYEYNMDLHNSAFDDGGDLNMVGGHYTGNAVTTTHPKASGNFNADGLDPNDDGGMATFPAWDPNPAPDPVQYACQKNFVLLITDGGSSGDKFDDQDDRINTAFSPVPAVESATDRGYADFLSLIGDHVRNPDGTPDETETTSGSATRYMDDIAKFMTTYDFRPDMDGDQTIDVYTVGYSVESTTVSNVEKAAIAGNGLYFESSDADTLAQDIIAALTDIIEKSQSFTSATVPASRTTDGNNFYSSYFLPRDDSPFWDGHLKNFKFTSAGEILTADDKCAIDDDSLDPPCPAGGTLLTTANAVWDAADEFPAPIDRKLFAGRSSLGLGAQGEEWFTNNMGTVTHTQDRTSLGLDVAPPAELAQAPYGLPDPNTTADLDALVPKLVSNIAGCDFPTTLGVDCITRQNEDGDDSILGDIFHSNPLIVGSPNAPVNNVSYKLFATQQDIRERDRIIYAGANDGWLHGFLAGEWDDMLAPPRHDRGTGEEVMGFMPTEIRKTIWNLPVSQPSGTVREYVTVDGSPVAADVWFYRNTPGGTLGTLLNPPVSTVRNKDQWRTVLVAGLRDGGRSLYALDITDPDASNYPGYLWDFPCQDCASAINDETDDPIATGGPTPKQLMGLTWSEPVITRVRVAVQGNPAVAGHERWVAIVGAGYDPCGNPNDPAYYQTAASAACDAADADKYSRGRAILMIDITTGELLGIKAFHTSDVSTNGGQVGYDEMKYAFASQPAVFDVNFDGYGDVVYIGDLGGNLWKWVISPVGDDPINNSLTDNSLGQPDWPFELFFRAEHSNGASPPTSTTHFQSFFFPPTAAKKGSSLVLAWGAGERVAPESGVVDADDTNNNHYYVVKDTDPFHKTGLATTLTEAELIPIEDVDGGIKSCSDVANAKGYFLTARDTEKFITNSVIFLGEVITASFLPAPPGSDPCEASGQSFLYRFGLACGAGSYPTNPGTAADTRRKAIGGGLPTRPRVSLGDLNTGGGGGGCANKVVLITSDGGIENDCPGPLPTSGINIRTWRER